jgi:hypothetical protein
MFKVYYKLNGELQMINCGSGPESAAYAWRIVVAYLGNRAWLEWEAKR